MSGAVATPENANQSVAAYNSADQNGEVSVNDIKDIHHLSFILMNTLNLNIIQGVKWNINTSLVRETEMKNMKPFFHNSGWRPMHKDRSTKGRSKSRTSQLKK